MNLTPVRVRGKRKSSHRPPSVPNALAKTRLRPHKSRGIAAVRAARSSRRTSLESLPSEIIEMIFLYSLNTSLPLASHRLGAMLSSKATLIRYLILVFGDSWKHWFERPFLNIPHYDDGSGRKLQGPRLEDGSWRREPIPRGDPELQLATLELPWINVNIILQAQQAHHNSMSPKPWDEHTEVKWTSYPPPNTVEVPACSHDRTGGFGHFNAHECFESDYLDALKWTGYTTLKEDWVYWRKNSLHPLLPMPNRLLTGPWDEAKQRLLFYLVRGSINFPCLERSHIPWESKVETIESVVITPPVPRSLVASMLFPTGSSFWFADLPVDQNLSLQERIKRRLEEEGLSPAARTTLQDTLTGLSLGRYTTELAARRESRLPEMQ